jgi:hypothetical protein
MTIGGWTLTTCRMWQSNSSLIHGDEEEEEEGRKDGVVDCGGWIITHPLEYDF